ncbi:DNA-binding response OmpR family regulator [Inhella inkyongensis]|uniref:DNA-binding response OmpR family regulator n=1 Tax=Inhella inkyongensis TaxID=392593 RepID=A0A840S883_9BURK|nr:response regulator transcription factor [Inhella inkyongensis]MBB5204761.1 DNA-binding response OmpR family regulator [Inhella inkyongensis]
MRILLIEDEAQIADIVTAGLGARGFTLTHCPDGREGLALALQPRFDAIVLDLMLPGLDGMEVLKALRAQGVQIPVLLLTARNELGDRLSGLSQGADDYLAKPFYVEELAARLEALLRRVRGERQALLQLGPLTLDRIARTLAVRGRQVELTTREYSLLEYLMRSAGQVFTRAQILEQVWGYDFDPATNVVDVCVKRLRAKLAEALGGDPEAPSWIEAVRGTGYRLRQPAD